MGISIKIKNKMKYLKLYEDIDPFEEDWDEEEFDVSKKDYWVLFFLLQLQFVLKNYLLLYPNQNK